MDIDLSLFFDLPNDIKYKIMTYYPIIDELRKKLNEEILLKSIEIDAKRVIDEIINNILSNFN